jgi:membrane-associated phospholipid phosphatase
VARALALLHVAILEGMSGTKSEATQRVAADGAAGRMVDYLFPLETPGRFEAIAWSGFAAAVSTPPADRQALDAAWSSGRRAADRATRRAMADGADRVWDPRDRPPDAPGRWRATPPLNAYDPLEPLAANWMTWVLKDGGELRPPPPVPYDSPDLWREAEEVLAVSRALTPEQKRIAEAWNLGVGSVTPAGVWNLKARELILAKGLDSLETARVLAVLNVTLADATISAWHVKFDHWTVRPVTVIRERWDPEWLPYLLTPSFPSYVSAHATVSGAAAEVLAAFFPEAAKQLQAIAEEAAMSRLYGGIHYRSDNEEGLKLGQRIGRLVLERLYGPDITEPLTAPMIRPILP